MLPDQPPIVALVGPTAVGKSAVAMKLAARFGAVIVTADSRQVYRYLDIGTAKPTSQERAAARHEMLDLIEPSETYSAQRYRDEGTRVLQRVAAMGRLALVVGGTGYYVQALLDRVDVPAVPPDPRFRESLRSEAAALGPEQLHRRLVELDPAAANRIHPNNVNRVIRALEIVDSLGEPVPATGTAQPLPALYIGLTRERTALHELADRRVVSQVGAGLVEETRLALAMGYDPGSPGLSGFGYRQMSAYLAGQCDLDTAISDYQAATRQYIRRQLTWFRRDERITWLDAGQDPTRRAAQLIEDWLQ